MSGIDVTDWTSEQIDDLDEAEVWAEERRSAVAEALAAQFDDLDTAVEALRLAEVERDAVGAHLQAARDTTIRDGLRARWDALHRIVRRREASVVLAARIVAHTLKLAREEEAR